MVYCTFFLTYIGGGISAYKSYIAVYPDLDLVVSVLSNVNNAGIIGYISYHVVDELLGLPKTQDWLFDKTVKATKAAYEAQELAAKGPLPEKIENKPHVHALQEYVGEYTEGTYGDVSISLQEEEDEDAANTDADQQQSQKEKKQVLYFKYGGFHDKMEHYHFETFKVVLNAFANVLGAGVSFQTGPDGKVSAFVFLETNEGDPSAKGKETVFKRKETKVVPTSETKEE